MRNVINQPQHAAAHLEQAMAHLKAALVYWQTSASGREELDDITTRLAILIDESGPLPPIA
ncbi:hypothetical protein [Novosphingobium huizhouense]|uniref:hypothetical protein n=1 Tax=Novosphingobium huizhouense TaxID=2866625 RepID=UPI001CD87F03|nr:hypothetical protein [Novosphingobium huizhouense]